MSDTEINVNEIVGHAAADLIESFFTNVGSNTKDQIAKYKVRYGRGFTKYFVESIERYSNYKTLINRYDAVKIEDNYVPVWVRDGVNTIRDDDFFKALLEKKRIIVEGTAGLGKTLFVRYMFRHAMLYQKKFIPILFELRNLHLNNSLSLTANLVKQVSDYVPGFNEEHFKFGMQAGKFIIFLDGIDEISLEDRTRYAVEILDLAYRYTETPILLSTRPDDFYIPWEAFRVVKLLPMSRSQTTLMLSKLQFDAETKSKFISSITEEYFQQHSEFLSVPLLATLMMLTFSEFSAVPSRIHVFYEQAFQTLFHKHDFIKGAFSRNIESRLDVEQFRRVLAAFCFISYLEERFSFLQYQAIENIRAAAKLVGYEFDTEAFLKDLLVTICLLQRDGNYITFVHRSFQEYFAALFVVSSPPADIFDIVEGLMVRGRVDAVVRMALQLNDGVIEQEWVIPKLNMLEKIIRSEEQSDLALIKAALGQPLFQHGLVFQKEGAIDWASFNFISKEYSASSPYSENVENYYDDAGKLSQFIEAQRLSRERGEAYNKAVLGAHKRELNGERFNLSVLPAEIVNSLRCVRETAAALREIFEIRANLTQKHHERSKGIKKLLSRYK